MLRIHFEYLRKTIIFFILELIVLGILGKADDGSWHFKILRELTMSGIWLLKKGEYNFVK